MITTDRPDNPVRCRKDGRLGISLSGRKDWGPMEPVGVPRTYKHSGNNGGRISNKSFYKNQKAKEFTSSNIENGKHQERDSDKICKEDLEDLGIPVTGRDHDYCGISPGYSEQNSGRRIQEGGGPQRMETEPINLQRNMQTVSIPTVNRPVCIETLLSTDPLHVLESGPLRPSGRCNATEMGPAKTLCIPTILPRQGIEKGKSRGSLDVAHSSNMADPEMFIRKPLLLPGTRKILKNPKGANTHWGKH